MTPDELLERLYRDPATGLIGATKLYRKAKEIDNSITLRIVKEWYSNQLDIQRLRNDTSTLTRKPILEKYKITSHNPNSWQIDLAFHKNKAVLTTININSRIGYAKLLQNKRATTVLSALKQFVNDHTVDVVTSDNGSEFMNSHVQKFFKETGIEHYNNEAGDHHTMGKIERFNRTLKQRLMRTESELTTKLLNSIIGNYNSTHHRAIDATPNQMKGQVIESELEHNRDLGNDVTNSIQIGDKVLYRLPKKTFGKETVKWSKTVYEVVGFDGYRVQIKSKNNHTLYKSHGDIKRVEAEVTDAPVEKNQIWVVEKIIDHKKLRNGKHKYLVKWEGFDENTWEPEANLRLVNKNRMSKLEKDYFSNTRGKVAAASPQSERQLNK